MLAGLKNSTTDVADFNGAELGDGRLKILLGNIKCMPGLRSLKLSKNKITDVGLGYLLGELEGMEVRTIHLSQNLLTEKSLNLILEAVRAKRFKAQAVSLGANNFLPGSKFVKARVLEIKALGLIITI